MIARRSFLQATLAAAAPGMGRTFLFRARGAGGFLNPEGKLARMRTDGGGREILDFHMPNQIGWGVYAFFRDGRRAILLSIEMNPDWKTKSFYEYYSRSRTHIWIWDMPTGKLTEIADKQRLAPFYAPCALLPGEDRMAATVSVEGKERLYIMDLDGTHPRAISGPNEYVYGVSASPDGKRLAFHANYRIEVATVDGARRTRVAGHAGDIYFGTSWSPDGEWILFQVCHQATDPGHDWSDIWIGRPDGSENRPLTKGQAAWFATSYGARDNPGGGSNMPRWAPDGSGILYARRLPGSKSPWEYQGQRTDTTHFNRDFKPEAAQGGTQIVMLDPRSGSETGLSGGQAGQWDFRGEWSPDSRQILFCRAGVGENPAIWVMERDGGGARMLTRGIGNQGADFPQWVRG